MAFIPDDDSRFIPDSEEAIPGNAQPTEGQAPRFIPDQPAPARFIPDQPTPQSQPTQAEGPMPSTFGAVGQGLGVAWGRGKQTEEAVTGQKPEEVPETSPAAQPMEWGDILSLNILPKLGYQLGKSAPTLAAGIVGGAAGTAIGGPGGGVVGGTAGAAAGAALQEIGPYFSQELKKSPSDPDGAWTRALHQAEVSGVFSGAAWALFPVRMFQGPLKQLAFQALGVQPAVGMAEQATQNVLAGQPATKDLGQAYAQSALGSIVPVAGHEAIRALTPPTVDPNAGFKGNFTGNTIAPVATRTQGLAPSYKEINMTPAAPQPQPSGVIAGAIKKAVDVWKGTFQPESINDAALQATGIVREMGSKIASQGDSIFQTHEAAHYAGEKFVAAAGGKDSRAGQTAAINFMSYAANEPVPAGYQPPQELMPFLPLAKNLMKWVLDADDKVGFDYGTKGDDYFPRQWETPDRQKAAAIFMQRTGNRQPGFQKPRTLEFLRDGDAAGLKLVTYNPFDLIVNRLMASAEGRARMDMLGQLNDAGMAQPLDTDAAVSKAQYEGWQIIKDPTGRQWGYHPDIQPVMDRVLNEKGLWSDPSMVGNMFRKWMSLKNSYVPLKLALSLFHPLHVMGINFANGMAQGWTELSSGRPIKAADAFAKGIYGMAANAIPGISTQAKFAREAWLAPEWSRTPEQAAIVKTMQEGGFSPQLAEELRQHDWRTMRDSIINSDYGRAMWHGGKNALAYLNPLQKPMFEQWIPSLKTAAYLDAARSLSERRPDIFQDDNLRRAALQAIAKSVDNRYGEMFYKNLMWNKILKDAGIGSFLSLGWNLGFLREFGGGLLEPFMRNAVMTPTQEAIYAAKNKFMFSAMYAFTAMLANGLTTYFMTQGQGPNEMMDYILPRIGGLNPDGTPRRITNMWYTREIPMLQKHIEEEQSPLWGTANMLYNKTLIEPFREMLQNRDYYGYEIMDPSKPWYQQTGQLLKYIAGDQLTPITFGAAKKALQGQGQWSDNDTLLTKLQKVASTSEGWRSLAGFGPAPAYASRSDTLNRLNYLFQHYVAPELRPQAERDVMQQRYEARLAYNVAKQQNDPARMQQAAQRLKELLTSPKQITPDKQMFQKLPWSAQIRFLQELNKQDFKHFYSWANNKTRADEDIRALVKRYYQ